MKINQFIFIFLLVLAGFLSLKMVFGLFTSAASNNGNNFIASDSFPTKTPTPTVPITNTPTPPAQSSSPLLINEVYLVGDFKDEWVEIYNPSSSPVSVNGYRIEDDNGYDTLPDVSIPAGGYGIIKGNDSSDVIVPPPAVAIEVTNAKIGSNGFTNAGDKVVLRDETNALVDQMSYGTNTEVFSGLTPPTISGNTLARNPNGIDTGSVTDWQIRTASIGVTNP